MTILLEMGADPNARDHEWRTCLHLAANNDSVPAVKLLLKYKVNYLSYFVKFPTDGNHHHVQTLLVTPVCYIALQIDERKTKQKRYSEQHIAQILKLEECFPPRLLSQNLFVLGPFECFRYFPPCYASLLCSS